MTASAHILVTGGTGKVGSRIVERLNHRGFLVRVATRGKTDAFHDTHREHAYFDWGDETSYDHALEGIDCVYLIPPIGVVDPSPLMRIFIQRALSAGVRRIVLQTASCISVDDPGLGVVHRAVQTLAPEWAVLRPSWFMQNFTDTKNHFHAASIKNEHTIVASDTGRVGFVDAEDIAEVAVHALIDERSHNTDHIITGPQALSYAEVAEIISAAAMRPIRFVGMQPEGFRAYLLSLGYDADFASFLAQLEETWVRSGREDRVTSTVERITGRPPRSLADFAAAHAHIWQE
jgi:uncharacterized protein YbjT (DUF2867 family)